MGGIGSFKKFKEIDQVQLLDLEDETGQMKLYLVTGSQTIFLVGPDSGANWARLLTPQELLDFPYEIIWSGPATNYEANSYKVTECSEYRSSSEK